jgi:dCTP deaminase
MKDVFPVAGLLPDWMIRDRTKIPADHPDPDIRRMRLVINPWVDYGDCPDGVISYGLSSAGYDIRVAGKFALFSNTSGCVIDPKKFSRDSFVMVEKGAGDPIVIPPNSFALAETVEYMEVPDDVLIVIMGKSTLARCATVTPMTPFEPGWNGKATLEIANDSPLPLRVYPFEGIAQMLFLRTCAFPERTYGDKPRHAYQDQKGLTFPSVRGTN